MIEQRKRLKLILRALVTHMGMMLLGSSLVLGAPAPTTAADSGAAAELFLARIGPLFKRRCLGCHGDDPKKLKGGLDLRSRDAMLRGGESGEPAVTPGVPGESPLYTAVIREDPTLAMPPKENDRLAAEDVTAIRAWIEGGAPWPLAGVKRPAGLSTWESGEGVTVATSGGLSPEWTNRRYKPADLWAYQPLRKPALPASDGGSSASPIDAFLDATRVHLGLEPAPPAGRRTLIRRATFDLTGLPPTPEEVEAFVSDPDGDEPAYGPRDRPPARLAALRRADGPPLARCRALRR